MREHFNILQHIEHSVERHASQPCFHYKDISSKTWHSLSWDEVWQLVNAWGKGLIAHGVTPGTKVAILSSTRYEWTIADLAIMSVGAITVPIYPTLTHELISEILEDSGAEIAFIENKRDYKRMMEIKPNLTLFPFDHTEAWGREVSIRRLVKKGRHVENEAIESRINAINLDDTATVVYTSGTTGKQKGVVLSHKNIVAEVEATRRVLAFPHKYIGMVCLPLPHVFARAVQFYQLAQGCQAAYCESMDKLARNLQEMKPHFMCGVPRILEKIYERVRAHLRSLPPWKRKIFEKALANAKRHNKLKKFKKAVPITVTLNRFFSRHLIFAPLKKRLGGEMKTFISGGAALSKDIAEFFWALDLMVLEGYGLTETFAAVTVNRPGDYHFGTIGKPLPGVEARLADDGEILVKGEMIFDEYLNLPAETNSTFTEDGWLKTGDLGEYSKDGFLRIIGRKKELIITSYGKNIAPQPIETMLIKSQYIEAAMVYGDNKKYLTALIQLDQEAIVNFAGRKHISWKHFSDLANHSEILARVQREIDKVNNQLSKFETVKKFALLQEPFSVEGGELTPTLKIRRKETSLKYQNTLESLYAEAGGA